MNNSDVWKIINSYFNDNPQSLVCHHIESYNDFFTTTIFKIFKDKNPIKLSSKYDKTIDDFRYQCIMYFGGKDGKKIYFGKPIIYDENDNNHFMFPNEARMRNMTYGMTIHYDIEIEYINILEPGQKPEIIGGSELFKDDCDETRIHYDREDKPTNIKLTGGMNDNRDELDKQNSSGGSERPKKVPRKKRTEQTPMVMTTEMANLIREANEKSVNSNNIQTHTITLEKIFLGKFPIMIQSEFCILHNLPRQVRHSMGECRNDIGGYFIIDGKEKTVISQETKANNTLYIRKESDEKYLYSAEIKSVSENVSKPVRTLSVRMVAPTKSYSYLNIVVDIPNVRNPIPLFILFRALGIISDKEIITMCLFDLNKYESMVDLFIPSVYDAGGFMTQQTALLYISTFTKHKTTSYVLEILNDYLLPHIGENNYIKKAYYLGYITFRLLSVYTNLEQPTDRDNLKYKRIELVGSLITDLFTEYYTMQQKYIHIEFEKRLHFNQSMYAENLVGLIQQNYREVFKERIVEMGFRKAFKGNWGAHTHTKKIGIVQDLNRLSFNSAISHLRKTNLPLPAGVKLVGPRVLHTSHWGFLDAIDTPDGGNIGLHKTLSITGYVSRGYSREPMILWMREKIAMKLIEECSYEMLSNMTKVIINGYWAGSIHNPFESVNQIKLYRRNALIPIYTSVSFDIKLNTIFIYTDAGRICRPIFYYDDITKQMSFENSKLTELLNKADDSKVDDRESVIKWNQLITGFNTKKIDRFNPNDTNMYELHELYDGVNSETNPNKLERFLKEKAVIDYIDPNESETALIAVNIDSYLKHKNKYYTHVEIHESLTYGVMCNQIIFMENNPVTRNSFSCGQSKQAVSMYHTNHQLRMDKTAVVLNNGQVPIVKSRYLEHINHEENPYGENAVVAIMCYTGYNVEDAVLINEGALNRGLFNTTYYTCYEAHEESSKNADTIVDKRFTNIESDGSVVGTKPGYDYSHLDNFGIIKPNIPVNDKTILIGLTSNSVLNKDTRLDLSKMPKKGQLGIVDRTFITDGEEGSRIAKVRIREVRTPGIGDKVASRSGQKGTIGLIVPESDMPFTREGVRPDIIINPHALPSRMTIGQLVECIIGKTSVLYGGFSDCTAFNNKGSKLGVYGELLTKQGFHSSGNEILYNGMTGEQIETEIFIGPTYYMRLKHMVKDKINYRALGPRTAITKQPVSGRANDGGLRIGEMERDVLISHGTTNFLKESMLDRGDKYYMAICNQTGFMAIYNPSKNLFMSPMADGPIQFTGSLDGQNFNLENITKFGRSFSIILIPYTLKLLMQELQTMNIQMRIITDDNIQQLQNLSFSKNINKLTHRNDITPKIIINDIMTAIKDSEITKPVQRDMNDSLPINPPNNGVYPEYAPHSPAYDPPEGSPEYAPHSPAYDPPEGSPEYAPHSPAYVPPEGSPEYAPHSPAYDPSEGSPEYAPYSPPYASPENIRGGKKPHYNENIYNINDEVLLRGYKYDPSILWKIIKIGNNFITIQMDERFVNRNTMEENDIIQVVSSHEIYKPDFPYYEMNYTNENMKEIPINYNQLNPTEYLPTKHTGFNFAPVIKIVNGNDNSTDEIPLKPSNISIDDTNNTPFSNMITPTIIPNDNSHINHNTIENGSDPYNGIDFSKKLIIKKI
jgi:DNA-directed RNA polymerase II subunit RPB2